MCATRLYCYGLPCHAADPRLRGPSCKDLARLMPGERPVDQAVGCSGEHVYRGAALAVQGIAVWLISSPFSVAQMSD